MAKWKKIENFDDIEQAIEVLWQGGEVRLTFPGKDANLVNQFKEDLGRCYRNTYGQELRIAEMTRNVEDKLYVTFRKEVLAPRD